MDRRAVPAKTGWAVFLERLTATDARLGVAVAGLGLLAGGLVAALAGGSPLGLFRALLQAATGWDAARQVWNIRYVGEWLAVATPLILTGLSMGFAARAGLFNIGAEGQYIAGLTAAQFAALYLPPVPVLHAFLCVAAALAAGAVWGGLAGWLKARFGASEVVATIMLNYLAFYLSRWLTQAIPGATTYRTPAIPASAQLDAGFLKTLSGGSNLGWGFFAALGAALLFWWLLERTRMGYALRASGLNPDAAMAAGINPGRVGIFAMCLAGAFAGLAGASVALGSFNHGRVLSEFDNYGFMGIAVALAGGARGFGVAAAGLFFGLLASAQTLMQGQGMPRELAVIVSGIVVILLSMKAGLGALAGRLGGSAVEAPCDARPEPGEDNGG